MLTSSSFELELRFVGFCLAVSDLDHGDGGELTSLRR